MRLVSYMRRNAKILIVNEEGILGKFSMSVAPMSR